MYESGFVIKSLCIHLKTHDFSVFFIFLVNFSLNPSIRSNPAPRKNMEA